MLYRIRQQPRKDANNGKLKKKYIGKYFKKQEKMNISSEMSTTTTGGATNLDTPNNLDNAKSEQKKKKNKPILAVAN